MKHQLKKLWKQAFDSTTSYTNLFFDYLYSEKNIRFVKQDGAVASVIYTLPYDMSFCGKSHSGSYLCGVATDKKYRGQGLSSHLMKETFCELYQEDTDFCALIPMSDSLFHFYKRFGFSSVYQCIRTEFLKTGDSTLALKPLKEFDLCAKLYNEIIGAKDFSFCMPPEHFDFLAKESSLFSERAFAIYRNNTFCGYLFYTKQDGKNLVREIVTDNVTLEDAVNALCKKFDLSSVTVYTPCFYGFEGEQFSIGMLRIINVQKALEAFYRKEEQSTTFLITDEFIPENNGLYSVAMGKAERLPAGAAKYTFTVTELLQFLCCAGSPFPPYINMLLN